jgi:DNA-binding PadR family transcriptional regulator
LITDMLRDMRDPLREPTFLILAALAPQPLHGYAIIGEVAELSGGRMALRPGTLYGALDRLAEERLLEPDREEMVDGRLRRYYRLTDDGAAVLEQEAARLQGNAEAARRRLARRPPHRPMTPGATRPGPVTPAAVPRPVSGLA